MRMMWERRGRNLKMRSPSPPPLPFFMAGRRSQIDLPLPLSKGSSALFSSYFVPAPTSL